VVNSLARAAAVAAAAGAAAVGWGAGVEVRSFRLRRVSAPVLAPGSRPVQVLHISDLHLVPRQERKRQFVRALARLSPDLVVDTGDHLAAVDGLPALLDTLEPLLEFPGCFVYGSNDYVAPEPRNPVNYLLPASVKKRPDIEGVPLPYEQLRAALLGAGWADLDNATARIALADGRTAALAGVDDPHVGRDDTDVLAVAPPEADVRIAVAHAPYRRILDTAIGAGWPLVMCGHTHGGQLCLPGWGALVSNCDLPVRQASGLSRWSAPDGRSGWLHVSAGLGTSPFVPIRFACPPAATLLTLEPPAA
jgi:predicted MPP superfamily phosphohydrolase